MSSNIVACSAVVSLWSYDQSNIKQIQQLKCHENFVTSSKFNFNNHYILSTGDDGTICISSVKRNEITYKWSNSFEGKEEPVPVKTATVSTSCKYVSIADMDNNIRTWMMNKTNTVHELGCYHHTDMISDLTFCNHNNNIIAGDVNGAILLYNFKQPDRLLGSLVNKNQYGITRVTCPFSYPERAYISREKGYIDILDINTFTIQSSYKPVSSDIFCISPSWSAVTSVIAGVTNTSDIFLYDYQSPESLIQWSSEDDPTCISLYDTNLIVGTSKGEMILYDIRNIKTPVTRQQVNDEFPIRDIYFSKDTSLYKSYKTDKCLSLESIKNKTIISNTIETKNTSSPVDSKEKPSSSAPVEQVLNTISSTLVSSTTNNLNRLNNIDQFSQQLSNQLHSITELTEKKEIPQNINAFTPIRPVDNQNRIVSAPFISPSKPMPNIIKNDAITVSTGNSSYEVPPSKIGNEGRDEFLSLQNSTAASSDMDTRFDLLRADLFHQISNMKLEIMKQISNENEDIQKKLDTILDILHRNHMN